MKFLSLIIVLLSAFSLSSFAQEGTGVGLTLGSPNGVTGRTWVSDEASLG